MQRRRWAYGHIRRCKTPPPMYGSTEWLALPEGDAAKIAAVCVGAEAWAQMSDTLEDDIRREVDALRLANKRAEDADYQARAESHRESYKSLHAGRSFTERRAAQLRTPVQGSA